MITNKGTEKETFLQSDVFKELDLAGKAVNDIYQFKKDFRVKTIYENYNGLFKFGQKFKFLLSFLTGCLASIGLFFLFYFDNFTGVLSYVFIALAVIFGLSMAYGIEYAKHTILPIISQSWLRDKELKTGLVIAVLCLAIGSITSTGFGTYKVIELFYVPSLVDVDNVGIEQDNVIAEYQAKIKDAKADKAVIDTKRNAYTKHTGRSTNGWIDKDVYDILTSDISRFEGIIAKARDNKRDDKKDAENGNNETKIQHAVNKYAFVWVGIVVSLICEMLLLVVLYLIQKYKFDTLKQLDTIQSPIQTVLQLVENPLTSLKANLVGGNGGALLIASGGDIQVNTPNIVSQEMESKPITSNYSSAKIGFQYGKKTGDNLGQNQMRNNLKPQSVSTNELAKIELKILHYEKMVRESRKKQGNLKQTAAIERNEKALENRISQLNYWQKKKEAYQGKIVENVKKC